jgi:hypothetical protein
MGCKIGGSKIIGRDRLDKHLALSFNRSLCDSAGLRGFGSQRCRSGRYHKAKSIWLFPFLRNHVDIPDHRLGDLSVIVTKLR